MNCDNCLSKTKEYRHKCNPKDCKHWVNKLNQLEATNLKLTNEVERKNKLLIRAKNGMDFLLKQYDTLTDDEYRSMVRRERRTRTDIDSHLNSE